MTHNKNDNATARMIQIKQFLRQRKQTAVVCSFPLIVFTIRVRPHGLNASDFITLFIIYVCRRFIYFALKATEPPGIFVDC